MMKTESKKLAAILIVAFILRIFLVLYNFPEFATAITNDTHTYFDFAEAIRQGHFWHAGISAHRTPVYPLYLALVQGNVLAAILGQIIFSLVSVWLTYLLAKRLFNKEAIALIAGLLLAISQESITHSYYLLTETLYTFLLLLSVFFLVEYKVQRKWFYLLLSAMFIGFAILTRPIAIYLPFLFIPLLWFDQGNWKNKFQNVFAFILVFSIIVGAWVLRNFQVYQLPVISSISTTNLLYYNAASLQANQSGENEALVRKKLSNEVDSILTSRDLEKNEANISSVEKELALSIILADPFRYGLVHLKSDANNLLPDTDLLEVLGLTTGQSGTLDYIKQNGLFAGIVHYFEGSYFPILILIPFILVLGLEYIGGFIGTVNLAKNKNWYAIMVLLIPILYGLLIPGSPSNPRFRVPVMPYLVILAAYGIYSAIDSLRKPEVNKQPLEKAA